MGSGGKDWSARLAIAVILTAIITAGIIVGIGYQLNWWGEKKTGDGGGPYVGLLDVKQKAFDTFDVATAYTHGTNFNVYWYVARGSSVPNVQLGSGDITIEVTEEDGGYIYPVLSIPSGQSYYVDPVAVAQKNSRVVNTYFTDVTGDGIKDFVFKFWIGDVPIPASGNPSVYFYGYLAAYQKPSISTPSDVASIGTGASTKFIEWYLSFTNTKKAWRPYKIEFKFNSTDETKIDLNNINIPGLGYTSGSSFTYSETTTHVVYTYIIGSDLNTALWLKYGTNQLNRFDFDTKVTTHLADNDVLDLTITITGVTVTGAYETLTDTVQFSE